MDSREAMDEKLERLQGLLAELEDVADPKVTMAARELLQVVLEMHALGLSDLLAIVREAGSQPADTLSAKFVANPRVRGLLLLHDLHPEALPTRARQAVEHLRPHLGVKGVHVQFIAVEGGAVRIRVSATEQNTRRSAAAVRQEIEETFWELAPDATELVIEGLENIDGARVAYIPVSSITHAGTARG